MQNIIVSIPDVLRDRLETYAGLWRRQILLQSLANAVCVLIAGMFLVALCDWVIHPGNGLRMTISAAVWLSAVLWFVFYGMRKAYATAGLPAVAGRFERAAGLEDERIRSAVELAGSAPEGVSPWMVQRTVALAAREVAPTDPATLVDMRPAQRAGKRLAVMALILLAVAIPAFSRGYLIRAFLPILNLARPSALALSVSPGDAELGLGSPLRIVANTTSPPAHARVRILWDDGVEETLPMQAESEGLRNVAVLGGLARSFRYVVVADDAESREYSVVVRQPPRVESIALHITPPAYTGLKDRRVDSGDATVLTGSRVDLYARLADGLAVSAELLPDPGETRGMRLDDTVAHLFWTAEQTMRYRIRLVDAQGAVTETPQTWRIAVRPDELPKALLIGKGLESGIIGIGEMALLKASAHDDIALVNMTVEITREGIKQTRVLPLPGNSPQSADVPVVLDTRSMNCLPGDTLALRVSATDAGGQTAWSRRLDLVVADTGAVRSEALLTQYRDALTRLKALKQRMSVARDAWERLGQSYRPEDAEAHRGSLLAAGQKVRACVASMQRISRDVHEAAMESDPRIGPVALELAAILHEWRTYTDQSLVTHIQQLVESGTPERSAVAGVPSSLRLAEDDLAEQERSLALVVTALEADSLARRCDASRSRQSRMAALVQGYLGWREPRYASGLEGLFFGNRELKGKPLHSDAGVPKLKDFSVPKHGDKNWSVRYRGEIRIPEDGNYTFAVSGDDGVRLRVGKQSLLPKDAWSDHDTRTFKGTLTLRRGWHPIQLEMYQGEGGSSLLLSMASEGGEPKAVSRDQLRHVRQEDDFMREAMVRQMTSSGRDLLRDAGVRLHTDWRTLSKVPSRVAQLADTAGSRQLADLAKKHSDAGSRLHACAVNARKRRWTGTMIESGEEHSAELDRVAAKARDHLFSLLKRAKRRNRQIDGDIDAMRAVLDRLQREAQTISKEMEASDPSERDADLSVARQRLKSGVGILQTRVDDAKRSFAWQAARPDASLPERSSLLEARRVLADTVSETMNELTSLTASEQPDDKKAVESLQDTLSKLDKQLTSAAKQERAAARSRVASDAKALLKNMRENDSPERIRQDRLDQRVGEFADQLREMGEFADADALQQQARQAEETGDPAALIDSLREWARDSRASIPELAPTLKAQAERAGQDKTDINTVAQDLAAARLEGAVAAELKRKSGQEETARGYQALGQQMETLLVRAEPITAEDLKTLSRQAEYLEKGKSDLPAALAGTAQETENPTSSALETLSRLARQATKDDSARNALEKQLDALAESHTADSTAENKAAEMFALADQARETAGEIQQAKDTLAASRAAAETRRAEFAEAEKRVAERLDALRSAAAATETKDGSLRKAVKALRDKLPDAREHAAALARKAESANAPDDNTQPQNPESMAEADNQLAADARELAQELRDNVAVPFARAVREKTSHPKKQHQAVVSLGEDLADAVVRQQEAAGLLEDSLQQESRARVALQDALARGAVLDDAVKQATAKSDPGQPDDLMESTPAAGEDLAKASAQQRAAAASTQQAIQAATSGASPGSDKTQLTNADRQLADAMKAQAGAINAMDSAAQKISDRHDAPGQQARSHAARELARAATSAEMLRQTAETAPALPSAPDVARQAAQVSAQARQRLFEMTRGQAQTAEALQARLQSQSSQAMEAGIGQAIPETSSSAPPASSTPQQPSSDDPAAQAPDAASVSSPAFAEALQQARTALDSKSGAGKAYAQASRALADAAAQARLQEAAGSAREALLQSQTPASQSTPGGSGGPGTGEGGTASGDMSVLSEGSAQAGWSRLPDRVRDAIRSGGIEAFGEEYQATIRTYFRRLSEEQ